MAYKKAVRVPDELFNRYDLVVAVPASFLGVPTSADISTPVLFRNMPAV